MYKKKNIFSIAMTTTVVITSTWSRLSQPIYAQDHFEEIQKGEAFQNIESSKQPLLPEETVESEATQELLIDGFATVDQLQTFNTIYDDDIPAAKINFGLNRELTGPQQWWIVGSQHESGLTLLATDPLTGKIQFDETRKGEIPYDEAWNCQYLDGQAPEKVYPNHYGASHLRTVLNGEHGVLNTHFTDQERELINPTTIYTNDTKANQVYSTTDRLYLPYGNHIGKGDRYITVGTNGLDNDRLILNNGLRIDIEYWDNADKAWFWLRSPDLPTQYGNRDTVNLISKPNNSVGKYQIPGVSYTTSTYAKPMVVPAFELDLSTVLFASTLPAAGMPEQTQEPVFTLRYDAKQHGVQIGSAIYSEDMSEITIKDLPSDQDVYVYIQNQDHIWTQKVKDQDVIGATNISSQTIPTFENCRVWLETTDDEHRMTYASKAKKEKPDKVHPGSGSGSNTGMGQRPLYPVYRAYNPNSGEHFYTLNEKEFKSIIQIGWNDEGIAFMAAGKTSGKGLCKPLYRVYNPNSGLHHYTIDEHERDVLISLGWHDEDVAWYVSTKPMQDPVYRLYNPNDGHHLYTMDEHEKDVLDAIGWNYEGLAFRTSPIETK